MKTNFMALKSRDIQGGKIQENAAETDVEQGNLMLMELQCRADTEYQCKPSRDESEPLSMKVKDELLKNLKVV